MNFNQALEAQLKRLDDEYAVLRELAADPKVLNDECEPVTEALNRLRVVSDRVFRLKQVWYESKEAIELTSNDQ